MNYYMLTYNGYNADIISVIYKIKNIYIHTHRETNMIYPQITYSVKILLADAYFILFS